SWKQALHQLQPTPTHQPYVHYFSIPVEWGVVYPSTAKVPKLEHAADTTQLITQQTELMATIKNMGLDYSQFQWSVEAEEYHHRPMLKLKGLAIIYCILAPVVDEQQQLLIPKTLDPNYYTICP
ncbi:MAG: hypothetical protein AAF798_17925, partial [Bacteroidota bacterium]